MSTMRLRTMPLSIILGLEFFLNYRLVSLVICLSFYDMVSIMVSGL